MTIPFETGIPSLLKEKGFDEHCYAYFFDKEIRNSSVPWKNSECGADITAPDYDQVLDWLEEKHGIIVCPVYDSDSSKYKWDVKLYLNDDCVSVDAWTTRYEALNAGIIEAIKLIK